MTRRFSPRKKISEIPVRRIQQELITIFKNWGIPNWIKVDNGRPFGDPQLELIPPLALWLIGLGIKVIWNRPGRPTDNAKVERSQGVMGKWTEFAKCKNTEDLQLRLWEEAEFYNHHFPIRRHRNRTRRQIFAKLMHTGKDWNPGDFKLQRVLHFLSEGYWERKVNTNGRISLYGKMFTVGAKYRHQKVSVKLNPKNNNWAIFDFSGQPIKELPTAFSEKSIWNLDFS